MILEKLKYLFSIESMVKPEQVEGELPTTKEAYRTAMGIAWPSMVESVLVNLIVAINTMMVGGLGTDAIAAVGITNQPRFILLALILSLNVGVTAVVARRKGAGDLRGANQCLKQCMKISAMLAFTISVLGFLLARPLVIFAGAEPEIVAPATRYFQILMIGMFFNCIGLTICAAQRGVGNTRVTMWTNVTANLVNIVFNFFLIEGRFFFPRLETDGSAIATILGNFVAFSMAARSITRRDGILNIFSDAPWKFDKKTVKSVLNVSSSAMVEQVFLRIGFFVYAKMVASLGTVAFATHQICNNILSLSFGFGDGFSVAASSLVGQSLGAKRPDKARIYASTLQRMALVVSTILFFVFLLGGRGIVGMFSSDPQVLASGAVIMVICAFTTHSQTSQVIITGSLRGAGDTKFVAVSSLISIAIIRPFLTWLFAFPVGWGVIGAWIAILVDQTMRLVINFIRFKHGKWTKIEL